MKSVAVRIAPDTACSSDVASQKAACSLAHRRGKREPSVDTKLANAWLGFYVALTKGDAPSGSAATTEVATETSLSEVASSHGDSSPRRPMDQQVTEGPFDDEELSECGDIADAHCPTKRTRRSRRRRRTRGRGKKNSARQAEIEAEGIDEEAPLEADDASTPTASMATTSAASASSILAGTSPATSLSLSDASPQWPFQAPRMHEPMPCAILRAEPLPITPSKAYTGPMCVMSTSPKADNTPSHREASARTPPRTRLPISGSPLAQAIPSTPFGFAIPADQVQYAPQVSSPGSHIATAAVAHESLHPVLGTFMAPPCQGIQAAAPTLFYQVPACPSVCPPIVAGGYQVHVTSTFADEWRSWLSGGLSLSGEALAKHLQALAPGVYED